MRRGWRVAVPEWAYHGGIRVAEALLSTTRVREDGRDEVDALERAGEPYVAVFWHGRLLPLAYAYRGSDVATLVSRSRDGRRIASVARRWGYRVELGSSSRGGTAGLRAIVRHLQAGRRVALTPDGPRGPARVMKAGPLQAARLTGAPVVPVAISASRAVHARSWDSFMVPWPFSRVLIRFGRAVRVPANASDQELERMRAELEADLRRLETEADADVGG